ncbi:DUF4876 domain-containing protein [Chitinophaga alhagiae]|uniref:DUF4876 domain-containing protein n=1 Tax=Chitinophaga alhagiae TaxID=2203219 RepID=UPI000E5B0903|nr:DUF4876 domain-containing protein [Chitinophaga alhagiae]
MRQIKLLLCILAVTGTVFTTACKKDGLTIRQSAVGLTLTPPAGLQNVRTSNVVLVFKESNSGVDSTFHMNGNTPPAITLPDGSYEVTLEGDVEYELDDVKYSRKIRGHKQGVAVSGGTVTLDIPLFLYDETAGLVFKEIFFTGTVTPEGKQYNGDKYFIIYNNSEDTLYADGLVIAEAAFLSTTKREYDPNVMPEAFTPGAMVMIPGKGTEHPIYPGKQIVVANNAINHKEYNPNSFDLRKSELELTLLGSINVDNPEVPDLVNMNGFMTMHNRGFKSYIVGRLPEGTTIDKYKEENKYTYSYIQTNGTPRYVDGYKFPNSWIIDAVNLSVPAVFEWILTAPELDMGWTYCGKVDSDDGRYGKSVRRAVLSTNPDGRVILKDTNNSTKDFEAEAKPSLMQ